jgi:hypothetical protein
MEQRITDYLHQDAALVVATVARSIVEPSTPSSVLIPIARQ